MLMESACKKKITRLTRLSTPPNISNPLLPLARPSPTLQDFSVNSQTYKVRRKTASPEKTRTGATSAASLATSSPTMATLSPSEAAAVSPEVEVWGSQLRSRGAFYLEGDSVICHQYQLSLPVAGLCRIAVQVQGWSDYGDSNDDIKSDKYDNF